MSLLLSLAADRLPLAQRLVDGLFPAGEGYASRLTVGRRAQLGDEMVYRSTIGSSPADGCVDMSSPLASASAPASASASASVLSLSPHQPKPQLDDR